MDKWHEVGGYIGFRGKENWEREVQETKTVKVQHQTLARDVIERAVVKEMEGVLWAGATSADR